MTVFADQLADLERLDSEHRLRSLSPRHGIDFSSNDYLGLAGSDELTAAARAALDRGVPIGSGGSRLLRGNCPEHEALEAEAANFFGREAALFFPCGFTANTVLLATLPQKQDCIFFDELIHASSHEGMHLSRAANKSFRHNDPQALDDAIAAWRAGGGMGKPWISIESLYSMDGDFAPLEAFAEIADRHDGVLLVDEAHATGVYGQGGRGLAQVLGPRDNLITLHTCGKALGCEGALLCGPRAMADHIINRGRGFIFSTAPSPLTAAIVRAALQISEQADARRAELTDRIALAKQLLEPLGAQCHGSPIFPLVLAENERTMAMATLLQQAGFDVRGIRPPTVPQGSSRLRIVMTLNSKRDDIHRLAEVLSGALA